MVGLVSDPSAPGASIVPYRNFTPPSSAPDYNNVSVEPGSLDQRPITTGYDKPSTTQVAAVPAGMDTTGLVPPGTPPLDVKAQAAKTYMQQAGGGKSNPIKEAARQEWLAAGYPPATVEGIMRRINVESGWNTHATGDPDKNGNPTSFSLYQHHADRAVRLANYLQANKVDQNDPIAMARATTKFAISEMDGGDTIASKHKAELMNPNITPDQAYGTFTAAFERPAGSPGSEETNLRANAFGAFNAGAMPLLQEWQGDLARKSKEYDDAIAEGKDLRSVARAAMKKWEYETDHPPQDMREAWNQYAAGAIGLALIGGFFGKNHTAAINAAGEMLQAANAADVRAYDVAYKKWKDHNDNGLKMIELLHGEARDIVNDAKNSYDMTLTKLSTLSTMYHLGQAMDPMSLENQIKQQQLVDTRTRLIEAQHDWEKKKQDDAAQDAAVAAMDKQYLAEHPEANGVVPPDVHIQHQGQVKREAAGTSYKPTQAQNWRVLGPDGQIVREGAAYQLPDGSYRWAGTNEPVDVPDHGKMERVGTSTAATKPVNVTAITPDGKSQTVAATPKTLPDGTITYTPVGSNEPFPPGTKITVRGTGQPRSAPAIFLQKWMEEHPDADAEAVAMAAARFRQIGAMEQAFGSGSQGNTIRSLNVAIDHTDVLDQLGQALQNHDTQKINALRNRMLVEFGYEGPVDFDVAKKIVADEVVKSVLGNNAGTGAERLELQADFDRANSPEQLRGVINTARRLMLGQMRGLEYQYSGGDENRKVAFRDKLFEHTKETLEATDKAAKGGTTAPSAATHKYSATGAGGKQVWSDDGVTWFNQDGTPYKGQ